ncbi:hypothetical protein [uncultured Roseibium sp.]|uniref:hypothetical protein n=1 Tax=uncultured Roseibium sp. TaxID=1936171 RepID=UPI0026226533|nr:hypothetical protein [uncultured Roseibium sp.]
MLSGRSENDLRQGARSQETFLVFKILQRWRQSLSERSEGHQSGCEEPRQSLCPMHQHGSSGFSLLFFVGLMPECTILWVHTLGARARREDDTIRFKAPEAAPTGKSPYVSRKGSVSSAPVTWLMPLSVKMSLGMPLCRKKTGGRFSQSLTNERQPPVVHTLKSAEFRRFRPTAAVNLSFNFYYCKQTIDSTGIFVPVA